MDIAGFWKIIGESRSAFDPRRLDGNMDAQLQHPLGAPWSEDGDDLARLLPKLSAKYAET